MPKRFSTARGREFGEGLRAALAATGMTGRETCEKIGWDPSKLSDLLSGKGGCSEVDLAVLLGFCRTPPEERDHLLYIHRQADMKDWWQQHNSSDPLPVRIRTFVEHLRTADEFVSWMPLLIPGLLQIADYMRALHFASATCPRGEVEARVATRIEMQDVFRQGLKSKFYIHEQALVLPCGGRDVMRAQLHHLLQMLVRPNIEIRIVPTSAGAHAGLCGSFELMRFDRFEPIVFLEGENSNFIIESKNSISDYEKILKALELVALSAEESQRRISKLAT